ncbi:MULTISPECIES: hypothetical protein [Bacillus cereus group]|uniref:DUF1146 domain-containing protein n=1 Tax=Bacillus mycoides TaxID=1405 RepID=A0A1E8BKH0_BACMY|nr:hypothetical protein [Bacillus mycoides]OFD39086.1 hypothetical protein BWGOE2_34880 [Bacillus mycoides]OFD43880.1 hypothetical protein BWGOE1_34740 [Bacillus mycoides]OFD89887.1 hypothetical protein BWGOE11_36000 [Bacillus mycoides]OFD96325.1 hypothetical protein BWGOE13_35290 [Bacillus mycoides]
MEVFLVATFSAIIIMMTVFVITKACFTEYKRNDISFRKFIFLSSVSIMLGCLVSWVLPFGYEKILDYIN